jgi:hypothetical protein
MTLHHHTGAWHGGRSRFGKAAQVRSARAHFGSLAAPVRYRPAARAGFADVAPVISPPESCCLISTAHDGNVRMTGSKASGRLGCWRERAGVRPIALNSGKAAPRAVGRFRIWPVDYFVRCYRTHWAPRARCFGGPEPTVWPFTAGTDCFGPNTDMPWLQSDCARGTRSRAHNDVSDNGRLPQVIDGPAGRSARPSALLPHRPATAPAHAPAPRNRLARTPF